MLEPRETDIPALFLVFVVLPLVAYILLGRWSEAAKKKERISLLADRSTQEAFGVEATAAASVIPLVTLPNNGVHLCARCYGPATTRCSQCKSVRYCSGRCQIIHWRQVHKHECQPSRINSSSSCSTSSLGEVLHGSVSSVDIIDSQIFQPNVRPPMPMDAAAQGEIGSPTYVQDPSTSAYTLVDTFEAPITRRCTEKQACEVAISRRPDETTLDCSDQASKSRIICSTSSSTNPSRKALRHKVRESSSSLSGHNVNISNGQANLKGTKKENRTSQRESDQSLNAKSYCGTSNSLNLVKHDSQMESIDGENLFRSGNTSFDEATDFNCSPDWTLTKRVNKARTASQSQGTKRHKSPKPVVKTSTEQTSSDWDRNSQAADESKFARGKGAVPLHGSNGITSKGIMRMIGLKKLSKLEKEDPSAVNAYVHKKVKMLFPYEEFVKFFQSQVFNLSPRGLVNCGNSCYANAVLQCLTCTKPLTIYLLHRSHSSSCCTRDWCLMCELEQHVMMLKESGGPLSPSRILSHMRRINCQIGNGSQEDAHEFLRLLVASMQSICLEGLGGEHVVDPRLQETTFIQHTFGGRLRSKVKCLRCHHESEMYENILDLTLEIFGWVESLEDALTQFTSPEDLDGENMYRCGRCVEYVRAWKQLSIQEAPNVLTIVLKRFQEGSYGKINKCITFPEMLDMTPFMTGTDDRPPLYMLYAVVVHLDTLNASFSGHYISYIKDLQGNWFRIDDTEVQPVSVSQVMSEGAYILFYMRSAPRPASTCTRKTSRHQEPRISKYWPLRTEKSSRPDQRSLNYPAVSQDHSSLHRPEMDVQFTNFTSGELLRSANRNRLQTMETYAESIGMGFSDATSSDWSLFTSSDEASFTTESARDSFSTVDYADGGNVDPISSIFSTLYAPENLSHKTVACSMLSGSKPQTRFFIESNASVSDSYLPTQPVDRLWRGNIAEQAGFSCSQDLCTDSICSIHVDHLDEPQTSVHCNF